MKKTFKLLVAVMILGCMALVSGCGSSDKFVGKWIGMTPSGIGYSVIEIYEVKKNGDGYLLQCEHIHMPDYTWGDKYKTLAPGKTVRFDWVKRIMWQNKGATAKGNALTLDGTAGLYTFTYIENEHKLSGPQNLLLQKCDDKTLKEFKGRLIAEQIKILEGKFPGLTFLPNEEKK